MPAMTIEDPIPHAASVGWVGSPIWYVETTGITARWPMLTMRHWRPFDRDASAHRDHDDRGKWQVLTEWPLWGVTTTLRTLISSASRPIASTSASTAPAAKEIRPAHPEEAQSFRFSPGAVASGTRLG